MGIRTALLTGLFTISGALAAADYGELLALSEEMTALSHPLAAPGIPDLGAGAIASRYEGLKAVRGQLKGMDVAGWAVSQQVDYLLVWSKLNEALYEHEVLQPWQRDPLYYLYQVRPVPYAAAPQDAAAASQLEAELAAVSPKMAQAKRNLTRADAELARLAVFLLSHFDGVGQGEPYRDEPPSGTIGWYEDLCRRLAEAGSHLLDECEDALGAVVAYRDWLQAQSPTMATSAAVGTANFNRYLTGVRLLPFSAEELLLLGEREFHRYRYQYLVDRNRNRGRPELELTRSAAQHQRRTRDAERRIREIVHDQGLLTIPAYMPDTFETDTFFSPRALSDRHFWEELQFRNALNNHIHASIPGHRFDAALSKRLENPIRRRHDESARAEGWATYLEELLIQAGITDDNPRARELFYAALIKRGSRVYAEIGLHTGKMSFDEANSYMMAWVPYMEEDLGRYDLIGYLRQPGLGSTYLAGKMQLERLLSERAFQLGDEFNIGAFHDTLLSYGVIPVTLIRWEMTGYEDEVRPLWEKVTGTPFPEQGSSG